MTDNVVKMRPGLMYSPEEVFENAKEKEVDRCMVVGITADGAPYIEGSRNITLAEMCWMSLLLQNASLAFMNDPD